MRNRVRQVTKLGKGTYFTSSMSVGEGILFLIVKYVLLLPFYLIYWIFKYSIIGIKKIVSKKDEE